MFIGLLYDHTFIKNYDRDFVGDAIISFYPPDIKEKVNFLFVWSIFNY
jgi:hypothetical protein